jgi:hypothetical protein
MLQNLQPKMRPHRIEIAVIVQQRMTVLDAKRADDQVHGLPNCDPPAT